MKTAFPFCGRRAAFLCSAAALALAACILPNPSAHAQTASFIGAQSQLFSGLKNPSSVAVDANGNVYICDPGNQRVLKETLGVGGYTQTTIGSGFNYPAQVAVDTKGNVYIADSNNNRVVKETLTHGVYVQGTVGTGLIFPSGVAVDSAGNVYIADTINERVLKEKLSGTTYTQTVITTNVNDPQGMAVDKNGNVYIADTQNFRIIKETVSGNGYTTSYIGIGLSWPYGVAVDLAGNVYIADTSNVRVLKEFLSGGTYIQSEVTTATSLGDPQSPTDGPSGVAVDSSGNILIADSVNGNILKEWQTGVDFGSIKVGVTSPAISLMFRINSAGTLGVLPIMTQGVTGQDFANPGTGSCKYGTFFFSGVLCTLDVNFKPRLAGDRNGAALLRNSSGQTVATGYLHGVGYAAQVQYIDASQKVVPYASSGQTSPYGVAVDGRGDVFIADSDNNRVLREYIAGRTYTETTVGSGLQSPTALAVDAAGNLFIADTDNNRVVKETLTLSGYTQSVIGSGLSSPYGVAVGPDGSVYISDTLNGRVVKETPAAGTYVQSVMPIVSLARPYGIAVDGHGNVYVSDLTNHQLLLMTLSKGQYAESVIQIQTEGIFGIAVDSMGNLYEALFNDSKIVELKADGVGYTQVGAAITGPQNPYGVAVDAGGNVYVADVGAQLVTKFDRGDAPGMTFADTQLKATSVDSPMTVAIENSGNMPLNIPIPVSGQNPSISNNFTLDTSSAGACPSVGAGSSSGAVLSPGQACDLAISFTPTATGTITGSLVFKDDALTPTIPGGSQQTISLSGKGVKVVTHVTWPTPSSITYGTALGATQLDATVTADDGSTVTGNFVYTPAAGTVLAAGSQPLSVTFTPTDTADYAGSSRNITLTVKKAVLTVTAKAASKTYGAANPALTYTIAGFVNGDTAATAVTGLPALTTTATAGSPAGAYTITPALGTLSSTNYSFKFVNGTLTVNKASLNITANDVTVLYGKGIPALTWTPTGFVNGDTAAALTGAPTETTTATISSPGGTYPITITAGTLTATNYNLTFDDGTLTITYLGTVATPVIAPTAGTYTGSVNVTITDSTPGVTIRYTTDGTTPISTSTVYAGAIHLTSTTTVRAVGFEYGYTRSATATSAYTVQ